MLPQKSQQKCAHRMLKTLKLTRHIHQRRSFTWTNKSIASSQIEGIEKKRKGIKNVLLLNYGILGRSNLEPTHLKTPTVSNKVPNKCSWQNKQWIFIVQQQALKCCLHNATLPHSTLTMNNITRKGNAIKASPYSPSPFTTCVAPTLPMQYSDNIKN